MSIYAPPATSYLYQKSYAENVWKYVSAFGGIDGLEGLEGTDFHRLSNGLTLAVHVHAEFDDLRLWFEEVEVSATISECGL